MKVFLVLVLCFGLSSQTDQQSGHRYSNQKYAQPEEGILSSNIKNFLTKKERDTCEEGCMAAIDKLITEVSKLQSRMDDMEDQIEEFPKRPMFFGTANSLNPPSNYVYKYDNIITQVGGGYNSDGTYSCPVSAYYSISYSVRGDKMGMDTKYTISAFLMKEGERINTAYSSAYVSFDEGNWMNLQAANSALIHCTAGEKIWLQAYSTNSNTATEVSFSVLML